jgi:hypothetical protein
MHRPALSGASSDPAASASENFSDKDVRDAAAVVVVVVRGAFVPFVSEATSCTAAFFFKLGCCGCGCGCCSIVPVVELIVGGMVAEGVVVVDIVANISMVQILFVVIKLLKEFVVETKPSSHHPKRKVWFARFMRKGLRVVCAWLERAS